MGKLASGPSPKCTTSVNQYPETELPSEYDTEYEQCPSIQLCDGQSEEHDDHAADELADTSNEASMCDPQCEHALHANAQTVLPVSTITEVR